VIILTTTNADRKLLALGVKSAAFTAKELTKILDYLLKAIKNGLAPTEQKSYADFQSPGGVSLLNVSPQQKDVQGFAELAQRSGVNVSVKQNQESQIFYLCLQGQLVDIEKTAKEYQKRLTQQTQSRSSLTARLEQAKLQAASHTAERSKTLERERAGKEK